MLKYITSLLLALFIASPALADLPCGQIKNKTALVTVRLNAGDTPGVSVTQINILQGSVSGSLSLWQSFALPTVNADGSYTVRVTGLANNQNHYFAATATGPFGTSPRSIESPTFIPAEISGVCAPPLVPEVSSVVAE